MVSSLFVFSFKMLLTVQVEIGQKDRWVHVSGKCRGVATPKIHVTCSVTTDIAIETNEALTDHS